MEWISRGRLSVDCQLVPPAAMAKLYSHNVGAWDGFSDKRYPDSLHGARSRKAKDGMVISQRGRRRMTTWWTWTELVCFSSSSHSTPGNMEHVGAVRTSLADANVVMTGDRQDTLSTGGVAEGWQSGTIDDGNRM